jgi:Ser/Thr protein kinase RdoA (MazF antagonist)
LNCTTIGHCGAWVSSVVPGIRGPGTIGGAAAQSCLTLALEAIWTEDRGVRDFKELTHLGKGRRLRPLARQVLRCFGVEEAKLRQFRETINVVFRVDVRGGERYLLRMTPPWHFHGVADVRSEVSWMLAVGRETNVGLPMPIATLDGEYVVTVMGPDDSQEWHCVLFAWIPGPLLARRWTLRNIERLGRLCAMLHAHASTFTPPEEFRIRTYATVFPHCDPDFERPEPFVLFDKSSEDLMPPTRKEIFEATSRRVQEEFDGLFSIGKPQPIHNDLHPWNVMICRDRLFAIDFENCLLGFPIQDVGTTLHYIQQHFRKKIPFDVSLAAFRRGYETVGAWPEQHSGQIATMMAAHRLLLCNFYAASKDHEYREFAVWFLEQMERRLCEFLEAL